MIIISGRQQGLRFPSPQTYKYMTEWAEGGGYMAPVVTLPGCNLVLSMVSILFHLAIFAAPLTASAHAILFDQAWHMMPQRINPAITDVFTMTAIISGFVFLLRRTFSRQVLAVSSWRDYAAMLCVLTPIVTGLLARKLTGPYEIIMVIHCTSANLLLISIGWTRLGHAVFFTAGRLAGFNLRGETTG
jgi:nitrate reductase gamma subunit